ncbi:thiol-disulfide oxidoreductase DCC family protein [Prauserella oleivorans]|uniref:Thiol-disulfide oxidoreductase DCC family protein n=1 Tax=Prauserella oleivorans TaxID=1478153 RepID=A0ABW5W5N5_9PSEU
MPERDLAGARLLFDGDCGFCTKSVTWLDSHDLLGCPAVPWQTVDDDKLPVPVDRLLHEVVLELPDGTVTGGADALAAAVRASRSRLRVAGAVVAAPGVRRLARAVYRVIARNRYRMPGASSACRVG